MLHEYRLNGWVIISAVGVMVVTGRKWCKDVPGKSLIGTFIPGKPDTFHAARLSWKCNYLKSCNHNFVLIYY